MSLENEKYVIESRPPDPELTAHQNSDSALISTHQSTANPMINHSKQPAEHFEIDVANPLIYRDDATPPTPWRNDEHSQMSLPEVYGSIPVPQSDSWLRKYAAFIGPGALVAVGYMDPGNWSTDLAGGSAYGYNLLAVILISSVIAMFLQSLCCKVGIATNRDLAQICRDLYHPRIVYMLWIIIEIAIIATDIAEVIGAAIAMKLLFNIPLIGGVFITLVDIMLLLYLQGKNFRWTEALVGILILTITACFAAQIGLSKPPAGELFYGFIPTPQLLTEKGQLYIAIGILGATVMPHNLFLHSSIVLTREMDRDDPVKLKEYVHYSQVDSTVSLVGALFVNAAILILAAATFHRKGYTDVADLEEAYKLLNPLLGSRAGSTLFGVALLLSGLNATLTGTLTGQIVMEGFTRWTVPAFYRRLITRCIAIIPAVAAVLIGGDSATNDLLIATQVILSFALPFAVVPLVHVTGSRYVMKDMVNSIPVRIIAYGIALFVIAMNIMLLV
jgi:manganese transport protein